MKQASLFLLLFALACGKAKKSKGAVSYTTVDMNEDDFLESLDDKRLQAPVEPVNEGPTPPTPMAEPTPPADPSPETNNVPNPQAKPETPTTPQTTPPRNDAPQKHPGVGAFVTITKSIGTKTSYSDCTGTLINGNEVILANHCIPESEKGAASYCSGMHFIHANEPKNYKCSKVLWESRSLIKKSENPKHVLADIMIIQLDATPTQIKSYSLARQIPSLQNSYSIMSYTPDATRFKGFENNPVLKNLNAFGFDYFFKSYTNCKITDNKPDGYPFRSLNCPVVGGQSGSPVFNSKNEIQGIVGGCVEPSNDNCSEGNQGSYFTDVSCLEKVNGRYSWKQSCDASGSITSHAPVVTSLTSKQK